MTGQGAIEADSIQHEERETGGAFYVEIDGERVAEMVYRRANPTRITVTHTEVRDALSGQGVARMLLDALVEWARATGTKVVATCPYARAQFQRDPSIRDVLA